MPPKRKRTAPSKSTGSAAKKKKTAVPSLVTEDLDDSKPVIYIEHCKS